ncbi:MAG TPA: BTAD domain-containing putative transcriptional regulator [Longimicrobiales bacterium]|nr:BTAD domain-containing putative transcriptional regulator [Longimicrobiales bacterium]
MITLQLLGASDVHGADGRRPALPLSGSKRFGLLAYLALAARAGTVRRDVLLALFWPELDQKHARNSLNNMLHQIRRSLGPEVLVTRGQDEVGLAASALRCDAAEFEQALGEGRADEALELYRGDLLEGFFVPGSSSDFEDWLSAERTRLRRAAMEAAHGLAAAAEAAGRTTEALRWSRRALALDPLDEPAARRLIELLHGAGDRAGALRVYEELSARLAREFELEPAPETQSSIENVATRLSPSAVAVLPFENLTGLADVEPFAMGLHDDLLTELSRLSELRVIARTSVLRYRGAQRPVTEIGRELGVGTVIEGGVQSDGRRLRLNVQVIDVATGAHRWAERYDRALNAQGIFDIQAELARRIAQALRAEIAPAGGTAAATGVTAGAAHEGTSNLEAYRLYAQGRAHLDQRTETGMRRSLDFFQHAVDLDAGYALAWAGLADALSLLHDYEYEPAHRVLPRALDAVNQALELAPTLAEAHTSLGEYHVARRNGPAAIAALRRAVELRPGYAEAHNWLGWMSQVLGDRAQALQSAQRAVALDPLSAEALSNLALSLMTSGNFQAGLVEARRTSRLQPDWTTGPFYEALALYHLGRPGEAVPLLRGLTVEWAGSGPALTLALALVAADTAGDTAVTGATAGGASTTHEVLAMLERFHRERDAFAAGVVELALGRRSEAFATLRTVRRWDYWPALAMHHFYHDVLAPLRADPLYGRLRLELDRWWSGG